MVAQTLKDASNTPRRMGVARTSDDAQAKADWKAAQKQEALRKEKEFIAYKVSAMRLHDENVLVLRVKDPSDTRYVILNPAASSSPLYKAIMEHDPRIPALDYNTTEHTRILFAPIRVEIDKRHTCKCANHFIVKNYAEFEAYKSQGEHKSSLTAQTLFDPVNDVRHELHLTKYDQDRIVRLYQAEHENWPELVIRHMHGIQIVENMSANDNDYAWASDTNEYPREVNVFGDFNIADETIQEDERRQWEPIKPDPDDLNAWFPRDEHGKPLPDVKSAIHEHAINAIKPKGRDSWGAEKDGDLTIDSAVFSIAGHFKRELAKRDPNADSGKVAVQVLGKSIRSSVETIGVSATIDKLQASLDKLLEGKTNVTNTDEKPAVAAQSSMAKFTQTEWVQWLLDNDLKASEVVVLLSADSVRRGQGPVTKPSEWDLTLEDALEVVAAGISAEAPASAPVVPIASTETKEPVSSEVIEGEIVADKPQLALVPAQSSVSQASLLPAPSEWAFMRDMAQAAIKSGLLPSGIKSPDAALYIIETGRELGIAPTLALRKIQIIQGQPTLAAELMLALVKRSGLLEFISIQGDSQSCTVTMRRKGEADYTETFTMDMARQMKTKEDGKVIPLSEKFNWRSMPATMLKWRAVSACCRTVFPDITLGIYTSEEMSDNLVLNNKDAKEAA